MQGYLQDTRLVAGHHGYLLQCPHAESTCPTCGQFRELQAAVAELQRTVAQLSAQLGAAESRVAQLETCECAKPCAVEGARARRHLDTWRQGCEECTCEAGRTSCSPVTCPPADCAEPDPPRAGQCCPTCRSEYYLPPLRVTYRRAAEPCAPLDQLTPALSHGEVYSPARCTTCQCRYGHSDTRVLAT